MNDTQKILLNVGEALVEAARDGSLPDRVHYNLVDTAQMLGRELIARADRIGVHEANRLAEEAIAEKKSTEFEGSQFRAADIFSRPDSLEPRAWAEAWYEAADREYGSVPHTALELAAHMLEAYRESVLADAQRSIAACVSALGIQVTEAQRGNLPEFIQLRDHIAGLVRDAEL
jgi:hypothetical protein